MCNVLVGGLCLATGLCELGVPVWTAVIIACAVANFVIAIRDSIEK